MITELPFFSPTCLEGLWSFLFFRQLTIRFYHIWLLLSKFSSKSQTAWRIHFHLKLTNSQLHLFFNRSIACLSKRGDSFELHIMTITIYSRTKPKLNMSPSSIESINFFPDTYWVSTWKTFLILFRNMLTQANVSDKNFKNHYPKSFVKIHTPARYIFSSWA